MSRAYLTLVSVVSVVVLIAFGFGLGLKGIVLPALGIALTFGVVAWQAVQTRRSYRDHLECLSAVRPTSAANDRDAQTWSKICVELELSRPLWKSHAGELWAQMEKLRGREGVSKPVAVVDAMVAATMDSDRVHNLLEPESIESSAVRPFPAGALVVLMLAIVGARALTQQQWLLALISLVAMATLFAGMPHVRERFPMFRNESRAPLVGVGFAVDRRGRRWSVNDAVLLVRRWGSSGSLRVTLIGAAGELAWVFSSPNDPDFIRLWQRWVHLRPRVELITE